MTKTLIIFLWGAIGGYALHMHIAPVPVIDKNALMQEAIQLNMQGYKELTPKPMKAKPERLSVAMINDF